jgi:hypothetical protein
MKKACFSPFSPWQGGGRDWERRAGVVRVFLDPLSGAFYHSRYLHPVERRSARVK